MNDEDSRKEICSGIHHPALVVPDLDAAIAFYENTFSGELIKRAFWEAGNSQFDALTGLKDSAAAFCLMRFGGSYIELFEYRSSRDKEWRPAQADDLGLRHLAFQVRDLDHAVEQLLHAGGSTLGDSVHVANGGSARYCRDPFGNIVELLVPGGKMPSLGSAGS
ncbi:MAG: VOC family protein [Pseudomonadota bacterium]